MDKCFFLRVAQDIRSIGQWTPVTYSYRFMSYFAGKHDAAGGSDTGAALLSDMSHVKGRYSYLV